MPENIIVVRANENLDELSIDDMINKGLASGFKASLTRVQKNISHIIITNTDNNRAVLGKIEDVKQYIHTGPATGQNMDGRLDIYFSNAQEIDPVELYSIVEYNNSNPVRYIKQYW